MTIITSLKATFSKNCLNRPFIPCCISQKNIKLAAHTKTSLKLQFLYIFVHP